MNDNSEWKQISVQGREQIHCMESVFPPFLGNLDKLVYRRINRPTDEHWGFIEELNSQ